MFFDQVEEEEDDQPGDPLRLIVNLRNLEDRQLMAQRLGQVIVPSTRILSYPVANRYPEEFLVRELSPEVDQPELFEVEDDRRSAWVGMPAYQHEDLHPTRLAIHVFFTDASQKFAFAKLLDNPITDVTKSIWFPRDIPDAIIGLRWRSTRPQLPKYPIYIPTKGRWESAFTIKCMERLHVPYFAVVQPQEQAQYAEVVKTGTMLLLPKGLDGLVPTRNWIYEHSIASGAKRHWQLDDNIKSFFRYHENRQIHVGDATCMRIAEDFTDRYENIAISGFQYFMFVPRKKADFPPYVFNTRVYSNSLINNAMPYRYRDVYNDDTDICLRAMKDGWVTIQFNAFLAWKQPTMQVKGGNTPIYLGAEKVAADWLAHCKTCKACTPDESPAVCPEGRAILERDGRWRMAESLRRQHPDVTVVMRKWNRWQHHVDYRRFKKNPPILRPGIVIPQGIDDYGLEIVPARPEDSLAETSRAEESRPRPQPNVQPEQEEPVARPSALDFVLAQAEEQAITFDPVFFRDYLRQKGHLLLLRDGKFFVSDASTLTTAERDTIKEHRAALIALATPWVASAPPVEPIREPEPLPEIPPTSDLATESFFEPHSNQTMAQFLSSGLNTPRADPDYVPDEPPDLTGIDEIVLNFATTGLNWRGGDRPCGVTVSTMDGKLSRFLPFAFRHGGNLDEEVVKRWARKQVRGKKIYGANLRFDMHQSREWGIDLEEQGCTFSDIHHTAALLDDHRKKFAIDVLAADYLPDLPKVGRADEAGYAGYSTTGHHDHHAAEVAEREHYTAALVWRLRDVMYPQIAEQELGEIQQLEDEVIPAVVEMEKNGSPIDVELLEEYHRECHAEHERLLYEVSKECGFAFAHSPAGWKRLLEHLGFKAMDSYSEAQLNKINHPLVKKGQLASQHASLASKTFDAYKRSIIEGVLYYSINQLRGDEGGTVSGRFSIEYVQQVPNQDNHTAVFGQKWNPRRLFTPKVGDYLEADAAQIEFRLFAHYANNPEILAWYARDPMMSFHKMTWERIKMYKPDMLYTDIKSFNFAGQYGARSIKLAVMMGYITEEEGDEIRRMKRWDDPRLTLIHEIEAAYRKMLPEREPLLNRAAHLAKSECDEYCRRNDAMHREFPHRGFVKTLRGRRSRFPNNYKTYIGLNRVLQGTGADYMKKKCVALHRERKNTGFVMRITNHDATLGDAPTPETLPKVAAILAEQSYPELKAPIVWECHTGDSWAGCK